MEENKRKREKNNNADSFKVIKWGSYTYKMSLHITTQMGERNAFRLSVKQNIYLSISISSLIPMAAG